MMNKLKVPKKYIGIPFLENGKDFKGADCIHLAQLFVENERGIKVHRMPSDIRIAQKNNEKYSQLLEPILFNKLIPGDIPFFAFPGERWHCGVYVGYGQMLHTVRPILDHKKTTSMVTPIFAKWRQYYLGAIRTQGKSEIIVPDAGWAVVAIVISIVTTIYSVVAALTAPQPKSGSNAYTFDALDNTISNQIIYPIIFGRKKYGGNIIWYKNDGGTTYRILVLGIGPWQSISDVRLNDIPIDQCPGCSYTAYLGTSDQVVDSRAGGEVKGLRNIVYLALTIQSSDTIPGGNPTVTCVGECLKMKTWNGSIWTGQNYSNNPAACLRHLLIMPREDGGAGVDESEIDDASFGEVYDYCAEMIDDGEGGTQARHQFDYIFNEQKPIQDAIKEILQPYGMYFASGEKITLKILKQDDPVYDFTMDNIDATTFEHWEIDINESYNDVHVQYSDPDQNDVAIDVPAINQADQILNGIRPSPDFSFLGISRFAEAARRAEFIKNESCINIAMCSFGVDIDALHVSKGSVVTVTHDEPGWNQKLFRVINIDEADNFKCTLTLKEENPSIYNDAMGSVIASYNYGAPPNPYAPVTDVTNLQATEGAYYLHKDGKVGSDINISWTAPTDATKRLIKEYIIELKKGAEDYKEVGRTTGATLTIYEVEDEVTYNVRVKIVSVNDIISTGVISSNLTILGKSTPPSDVATFLVNQSRDRLYFGWPAVPDVDLAGYEIRFGISWEIGTVLASNLKSTSFIYLNLKEGVSQSFWIKAIDTSGNYSLNATEGLVTIGSVPFTNIIESYSEQTAWGGTKTNTTKIGNNLEISAGELSGTYVTPVRDVGVVATFKIGIETVIVDASAEDRMNDSLTERMNDSEIERMSGFEVIGATAFKIKISEDNVNWSDWIDWQAADFTCRYFQLQMTITRASTGKTIQCSQFNYYADLPDVDDLLDAEVTVAADGVDAVFNKTFHFDPAVNVTILDGDGVYWKISSLSTTGCTVKLYDASGTTKTGNIRLHIHGV